MLDCLSLYIPLYDSFSLYIYLYVALTYTHF